MLITEHVSYQFANGPDLHFPDLRCAPGESWLLVGPSGSGKTTWLQLLAGLRRPTTGRIELAGERIDQKSQAQLDDFRGRHIGIVYQRHHFVRALRAGENLALAQQLGGRKVDTELIKNLMDSLGIAHKYRDWTYRMSVGEQQRLSIARAVVNQPSLVLADEPTSALDDRSAQQVLHLLQERSQAAGATLLIVTHDQRLKDAVDNQIEL